jgi:DUF1680 family protein
MRPPFSRRQFLQVSAAAAAAQGLHGTAFGDLPQHSQKERPLEEVAYSDVTIKSTPHLAQLRNTHTILMGMSNDSLLKPFRAMVNQPAPGVELGGWYFYNPNYNYKTDDAGLAPSATFGQWVSALARYHAATGDPATREKVLQLTQLYAVTIAPAYYERNRFPAYCYDKLVCGLMDAHRLVGDPHAFPILDATTDAAVPQRPGRAVDRDVPWRPGKDASWNWDESYTIPENLYLVYSMGAGDRYFKLANQYLLDSYFGPLAQGQNVLGGRHAYSYINALCSAMQAYLVGGSQVHLDAARNGFAMLEGQSFATGGWGPDELLRKPGSGEVLASLTKSHNSFETPCGSYAHMKLTRYLLRVTRDGRYGDSMERVMYNTVLGAQPLQADGHAFYYSDYNLKAQRVYSDHIWPCCSGTLPQVAADYGINTYLREQDAVWVNLYIPSILRWTQASSRVELEQSGDYPYANTVTFQVRTSTPANFTLYLRIPAWAQGASIKLNGKQQPAHAVKGFTSIQRTWQTGDIFTLELPTKLRLEAIDPQHPETAALLYGPLVLFATGAAQPAITSKQALSAQRTAQDKWTITAGTTTVQLLPFTSIGDTPYTTYLNLGEHGGILTA